MLNLYCSHSWVFLFLSDQQLFAGISYSSSGDMNYSFRNCSENFFSWHNALFSLERYTSICFGASKLVLLQVHRKIVCCRGFFLKDWKEHLSQRYWYFFHLTILSFFPYFSTRLAAAAEIDIELIWDSLKLLFKHFLPLLAILFPLRYVQKTSK